jgi:hypothetical protein
MLVTESNNGPSGGGRPHRSLAEQRSLPNARPCGVYTQPRSAP